MFGIGTTEIVVILIVALLVLGPKKLPEIARSLGKTLGEFRRVTTDVKRTIEMEADQEEELQAKKRIKKEMARKPSQTSPAPDAPGQQTEEENSSRSEEPSETTPDSQVPQEPEARDQYPEATIPHETADTEPEKKDKPAK